MNIKQLYSGAYEMLTSSAPSFSEANALKKQMRASAGSSLEEFQIESSSTNEIVPEKSIQRSIRPLFGKPGISEPKFGDHPDFAHLRGSRTTEIGEVTTLFMDIEGSTRLGILYPPDKVLKIKNAIICCAIETIQALDGHVHRIMGDSVMAYFRSRTKHIEDPIIDAINCASSIVEFMKQVVLPKLEEDGADHGFGIRVGLDHGQEKDVLWASYGYPGMEEVTATSFYVDVAAKLQQSAPRNTVMLGKSIRDIIDFPDSLLKDKEIERNSVLIPQRFITPNYTDRAGNPINYRQFVLDQEKYFQLLPVAQFGGNGITVSTTVHDEEYSSEPSYPLIRCAQVVPKGKWIKFKVALHYLPQLPIKVFFEVENHGTEAKQMGGENHGNHTSSKTIKTKAELQNITHWETTSYRGLHYLKILIKSAHGKTLHTGTYGVYIQ